MVALVYLSMTSAQQDGLRLAVLRKRIDSNRALAEYFGIRVLKLECQYVATCERGRMN